MRAEVRRAYRCPCDGGSHRAAGVELTARARAVAGELDAVEASTGDRPWACPWWSFSEPDVAEVLRAYDWFESGQCGEWWGDDPPWWLVLGVQHYHRVLSIVRAESMRLAREARRAEARAKRNLPQLPPGFEVEHEIKG